MGNITAANAVLTLSVPGVFSAPQSLSGFDVDNIFDIDPSDFAEDKVGVDGVLSAGFVYALVPMGIHLQADSPSVSLFEQWIAAQFANKQTFFGNLGVFFPGIGRKYACSQGVLKRAHMISPAHRVLQPRTFTIDWSTGAITAANA